MAPGRRAADRRFRARPFSTGRACANLAHCSAIGDFRPTVTGVFSPGESAERRQARSNNALIALSRLLEGSRRIGGLEALAVSDPTGCLVAGAGAFQACETLAAWAALGSAPANDIVPTRLDVLARKSEVRRLSIDGVEVLLSAGGGETHARKKALDHAAAGCQRILGRARPRELSF